MKYFIIAGEPSGEMHAASLVHALRAVDHSPLFRGSGGKEMEKAGVELVRHIDHMSFMGFSEVVKHLGKIRQNFKIIKEAIEDYQPDVIILVDYPGFNLRIAKWAKTKGFKVVYYIAPQVWAWKPGRIKTLQRYVDRLLVILPFEQVYFRSHGMRAMYVGHPLIGKVPQESKETPKTLLALLPGSRKQEIETLLPLMLNALHLQSPDEIAVAGLSQHGKEYYESIVQGRAQIWMDDTYNLLQHSKAALVTSGTATLEAALLKVPQVVCYKTGWFSYFIAKNFITVPHISLVNLILQRPLVPELIQGACTEVQMKQNLMQVIEHQLFIKEGYRELEKMLGSGDASQKAALIIFEFLNK